MKGGHVQTLAANHGAGRTLPVFSGEGEAEMFVWLEGAFEDGWQAREISAGELVSLLGGPHAEAEGVALDPAPGMEGAGTLGLVIVGRERFLDGVIALGGRKSGAVAE